MHSASCRGPGQVRDTGGGDAPRAGCARPHGPPHSHPAACAGGRTAPVDMRTLEGSINQKVFSGSVYGRRD